MCQGRPFPWNRVPAEDLRVERKTKGYDICGDQGGQDHDGVYCRKIKNKRGIITHKKYEPRLKRGRQSLSLGQYNTFAEAKLVRDIATFLYGDDECGWLDFEDNRYYAFEPSLDPDRGRYFVLSPLTEEKEGKEKSKLVSCKAKEVYKEFKRKQAEYLNGLWTGAIPAVGSFEDGGHDVEGHAQVGDFVATSFDLVMAFHNDQASDTTVDAVFTFDNCGLTSNLGDVDSEATPFIATDPSSFSDDHGLFWSEGASALSGENSQSTELPENHALNNEARRSTTAPALLSNNSPASGLHSNSAHQGAEALARQVLKYTVQQEKQRLLQLVDFFQTRRQELDQEKQELRRDKQELRQEKQELKQENQVLRQEKQELRQENQQLKQANQELKQENQELKQANRELKQENEVLFDRGLF